jgi:hypothetical protein
MMDIGLREVAESIGGVIVGLLTLVYKNLSGEVKAAKAVADAALPRADFVQTLNSLEQGRKEFREGQINLFKELAIHAREDSIKFDTLTKDFNGGMTRITDTLHELHGEVLKELNMKVDKK